MYLSNKDTFVSHDQNQPKMTNGRENKREKKNSRRSTKVQRMDAVDRAKMKVPRNAPKNRFDEQNKRRIGGTDCYQTQ